MYKNNIISEKKTLLINDKELISEGTQTEPKITQQAFTQTSISENLFLILQRQKEDSNLLRNLLLKRISSNRTCRMIGCERISRSNKLKYCESHWNETFICKISACQKKRTGTIQYCFNHFEQIEGRKNFCNVEGCINGQRRRGVCDKHLQEGIMK